MEDKKNSIFRKQALDRSLCLKDGKVCEDGSYDELIAKNGLFAELVSRQMVSP